MQRIDTDLIKASQNSDLGLVNQLLATGAAVDSQNKDGNTALMLAVIFGHDTSIVEQLLAAGAAVDLQNNDGDTALILAVRNSHQHYGRMAMVKRLLAAGAALDLTDKKSKTALMLAVSGGHSDIENSITEHAWEAEEYKLTYGVSYYQFSAWKIPVIQGIFEFYISINYLPLLNDLLLIITAYLLPTNLPTDPKEDKALFSQKAKKLFEKMPSTIEEYQLASQKNKLMGDLLYMQLGSL